MGVGMVKPVHNSNPYRCDSCGFRFDPMGEIRPKGQIDAIAYLCKDCTIKLAQAFVDDMLKAQNKTP